MYDLVRLLSPPIRACEQAGQRIHKATFKGGGDHA
jgi:hypothetical protein